MSEPARHGVASSGQAGAEPVPLRICFVCSGNICRSPTAEVVLNRLAAEAGLGDRLLVDSAGTGDWHAGHDMDPRARHTLQRAGYRPPRHAARQFRPEDFAARDLVVAIDAGHLSWLGALTRQSKDPASAAAAITVLRSYDPLAVAAGDLDVPDPYHGGDRGFELVLDQIERACAGLLASLRPRLSGEAS